MTRALLAVAVVVVVAGVGAGCGPPKLTEVQIVAADLSDVATLDVAVIGGGSWGKGLVHLTDTDGLVHRVAAHISTGTVGTMIDIGVEGADGMKFDLSHSGTTVASDLFGGYDGSRFSVLVGVGGNWYDLENDKHIRLNGGGVGGGIAFFAGAVWLGLDPDGDLEDDPAGAARQDAGP